ncbi:Voltage-gated Ion Channel (VIC) Superfamily, partial [Phytophthora palmivora]
MRSLTLYSGLRRILKALMRAVPFLANVGTLSMFGLLAFSIFGLEAYSGSVCIFGIFSDNDDGSFRSFASGLLLNKLKLFCKLSDMPDCVSTFKPYGWVTDIMKPVIESSSFLSVLFFVAIVASMVFLVVNLFVAVITTAFMNFTLDEEGEKEKPHYMGKLDREMEETHVNMIMGATLVIEDTITGDESSAEAEKQDHVAPPVGQIGAVYAVKESSAIIARDTSISRRSVTSTILAGSVAEEDLTPQPRNRRPASAPAYSKTVNSREDYLSLLAKMHQWQSLRNLTVETTMQLLQNGVLMEELMGPLTRSLQNANGDTTDQLTDAIITPAPLVPRKKAMAMEVIPDLDALHFSTSTHALVMRNTPTTNPLFVKFQRFVLSKKFDDFITICILLNTLFLLVEYPNMSSELELVLSVTEYVFGVIFLAEMIMRIIAMRGLRLYLGSTERVFDMVVVCCTSGNLILNNLDTSFSGLNSVSSLRTLRVTRLMMKYEGTRKLIQSVLKSSRGVMDVVVFMLVFQVVNSIIGMQLFGGSHLVGKDGDVPRWNFDTFGRSFLTLLQVITGDQWSSITYDAVDAANPHWFMVPFLILNFIVGQYVLLNLFIAVILENFSISEEEAYQLQLAQIIAIPKELDIYEKIEEVGVRAFGEMDQLENVSNVKLRMFLGLDDRKEDDNTPDQRDSNTLDSKGSSYSFRNGFTNVQGANRNNRRLSAWKNLFLDEPHPEMSMSPPSDTFDMALTTMSRIALVVLFVEFVVKVGVSGFGFEYLRVTIFHSDE